MESICNARTAPSLKLSERKNLPDIPEVYEATVEGAGPKSREQEAILNVYPLVEAIAQNVVKHPVLPDGPSREKLVPRESVKFVERWANYLNLGVIEWQKVFPIHEKLGKKGILFVMTDDTANCDDVAAYLDATFPALKDAVLTIHTNKRGEISESLSGKKKDELEALRAQANTIDSWESKYKAVFP